MCTKSIKRGTQSHFCVHLLEKQFFFKEIKVSLNTSLFSFIAKENKLLDKKKKEKFATLFLIVFLFFRIKFFHIIQSQTCKSAAYTTCATIYADSIFSMPHFKRIAILIMSCWCMTKNDNFIIT